jgi:hypothetical protein
MSLQGNEASRRNGYPLPLQQGLPKLGMAKAASIATIAVLAVSGLALWAKAPRLIGDCRTAPRPMLLAEQVEATMTIRGRTPCLIIAQLTNDTISGLDVIRKPNNGKLTVRGRTGLIYHPDRNFRGQDYFEYAMDRSAAAGATRSMVRVHVKVD